MTEVSEKEPHTIDLTPVSAKGGFVPYTEFQHEKYGTDEGYFITDARGKNVGQIRLMSDGWHIYPDNAQEYPMKPELRDDAMWLLLMFRDGITERH